MNKNDGSLFAFLIVGVAAYFAYQAYSTGTPSTPAPVAPEVTVPPPVGTTYEPYLANKYPVSNGQEPVTAGDGRVTLYGWS